MRLSSIKRPFMHSLRVQWQKVDIAWRWALGLHLSMLTLLIVWTCWISWAHPFVLEEKQISLWPGTNIVQWLERVLVYPVYRYDVLWYVGIATQGYDYRLGSTTFHPLYPLLIALLTPLLQGHVLLAAWIIAQLCCTPMLALLYKLIRLDYNDLTAQLATTLLLISPVGFTFLLPYTESLFMLCMVGAFYAVRTQRWWLAGILGAGAALAKQPGVLIIFPLLWEVWIYGRGKGWQAFARPLLAMSLVPMGLVSFVVYRLLRSDVRFNASDPLSFISNVFISPAYKDVHKHRFGWPWETLQGAFNHFQHKPSLYILLNLTLSLIFVMLVIYCLKHLRISYIIYSLIMTILSFTVVYELWPMLSILRRLLIVFPVYIVLAHLYSKGMIKKPLMLMIFLLQALLWVFILELYVRNAYIL